MYSSILFILKLFNTVTFLDSALPTEKNYNLYSFSYIHRLDINIIEHYKNISLL